MPTPSLFTSSILATLALLCLLLSGAGPQEAVPANVDPKPVEPAQTQPTTAPSTQPARPKLKSTFFGTGHTNPKRTVYMIDASGVVFQTLPFICMELKRSINEMNSDQEFTVIFFQGGSPREIPPLGLKKADKESKNKVFNWIDSSHIIAQGGNSPAKAIELASKYQPDLIYLLSDNVTGEGANQVNQQELVQKFTEEAAKNKTRINAIQFLHPDPFTALGKKSTLQLITEKTGGVYRFIDAKELGIE